MKPFVAALLVVAFAACEKKPTPEEIEAQEQLKQAARSTPVATPTPKPGSWMWKDHKNPLDPKDAKR